MEIGLNLPVATQCVTPPLLKEIAQQAEAAGMAEVYLGEHVVLFDDPNDPYPGSDDGVAFFASMINLPDPIVGLTYLAGCTERIRFGTGVALLPQRNPVYTAKHVATLDWLSGGRFDFVIGVGWSRDEFAACNVPFEDRGGRARDYLAVMKTLWCDPLSHFEGEFYSLAPCRQYPKPVQEPHPPLWFGGWSRAAFERVADFGSGWYGFDMTPEEVVANREKLARVLATRNRTIDEIKLVCGAWMKMPVAFDDLVAYAQSGVAQFVLSPNADTVDGIRRQLDEFADLTRRAAEL